MLRLNRLITIMTLAMFVFTTSYAVTFGKIFMQGGPPPLCGAPKKGHCFDTPACVAAGRICKYSVERNDKEEIISESCSCI